MEDGRPLVAIVDAVDRNPPDQDAIEGLARTVRVRGVDELAPHLDRVDVIFAWNFDRPRLRDVIPRAPRLRWIQSISAGVEDLAFPELRAHGVVLTNAAGVYDPGLAESVLGFLLAFSARILEDSRLSSGDWPQGRIGLLRGTTALIVGAGSIGTETGRLLRSVGGAGGGALAQPDRPTTSSSRSSAPTTCTRSWLRPITS